jgi:hypothetical protein
VLSSLYSRPDVPHYLESAVKMKSVIAEFLQAHPGQDCISHYHLPRINSIIPFLLVFNHLLPSVDTICTKMDWGCIARTPYSHVEQASKESSLSTLGQPCQFLFADYCNTSGLNQSRVNDPSGMPRLAILHIPGFLFKSQQLPFYLLLILASSPSPCTLILVTPSVTLNSKK